MIPSSDIILIGGGIIGLLTARELRQAGATVTVIDRQAAGRESTWAGGGIVCPLNPWRYPDAVTRLASWGQPKYAELCEELTELSGISPQWIQNGLLILNSDETQTALNWAERHQINLKVIDRQEIQALEPHLANVPDQALWMPDIAQVRNPRIAQSMRGAVERMGVQCREDRPVESLWIDQGRVRGVHTAQGKISADKVIVCAGAWSPLLLDTLPHPPAIRPVRGQMILFQGEPGHLERITLFGDRYSIPREDGRILIGSTLEETGYTKETTAEARESLREIALSWFPSLAQYPLEKHWAGLRPGSPSGIPYIGEHPEISGLFVNSGHYRNGVVLGPASARLAADLILARLPILDPAPYGLLAEH